MMCFIIPIAAAFTMAKVLKTGFSGHALGAAIGIASGFACAWAIHAAGTQVDIRTKHYPEARRERYFRVLFLAAILWVVAAGAIAMAVSSAVLKRLF